MAEIGEVVSDDYGFKLIDDFAIADAIDLKQHKDGEELRLLAIHDEQRVIAVSNFKSLKFVSADHFEDIDTVDGDFHITQLYFTDSKFYMLNNNVIQTLTTDQIKRNEYQFASVEGKYTDLKPLNDHNYLAFDNGNLYHNSIKIASSVIKYAWHKSSPIYITESDQFQIMGKPINYDEAAKDELSELRLVELVSISEYIFLIYDSSEEQPSDDHQIRTYLLKDENEKYTPLDIEIASPYGAAYRTTTYYTASIANWLKSTQLEFITSSLSLEIGILDITNSDPESIVPSEDSNKANYPIDDESSLDVSPVGFAISVNELNSKVDSPCAGVEGEVVGKLPRIYAFLDNGNLRSWWVFNKHGILNDDLSLENAIAEERSKVKDKAEINDEVGNKESSETNDEADKKESAETETTSQQPNPFQSAQQPNPFQTASNPFGLTAAGAFKSPVTASKSNAAPDSTKSAFGSTAFGSGKTSKFAFGAGQTSKSAFGSTGFASSASASSGLGSTGFASSGFASSGFGTTQKNTETTGNSKLTSGFGKFSNQKPATFGSGNGESIFDNDKKSSSPFGQLSGSATPFGKTEGKSGSIFDQKQQPPVQPKPMFGQDSGSKASASPFSTLNKDTKSEGFDYTRQTPYADPMESSKESTPTPFGFNMKDKSKSLTKEGSTQSPHEPLFGKTETGDLSAAFGGLNTKEKPSEPFGSSFSGLKKTDEPSPFASLQKSNAPSPFANLNSTQKPAGEDEHLSKASDVHLSKAPDDQSDKEAKSQTNASSGEEVTNEEEASADAGMVNKLSKEATGSSDEFDATENYDLSQDDEEDEVDDHKFVEDSEKYDSSWVNISKNDAKGQIIAQSLVDIEHGGACENVEAKEKAEEEPVEKSSDEPIEPVEFLVFDGFSASLEQSDDPIKNKMRNIIANTEGNLEFLLRNTTAVTAYIDAHSTPGKHWHEISEVDNLEINKDMYKGKLQYLHEKEDELVELNRKLQQSQYQQRVLDRSFSQLVLLEKGSNKNLKFLKNRPLEPRKQEMRDKLKTKLADVESLESKLRTLLMPIKAKNSLNSSTVEKIEEILMQLNDQVLDRKLALTELEEEMKDLDLEGGSKSLSIKPGRAKLNWRNRLRAINSKQIT
ncbi:NUP159 [Candida margitis]|uniref:NUP159 n=1 Tax=Candida margitis TaxID=1775924 RepID=UPI002226ABF9|nr:NUP159 [Candida margitis]KAI5961309.1 NUP159 [Candida margitis]